MDPFNCKSITFNLLYDGINKRIRKKKLLPMQYIVILLNDFVVV